MPDLPRRTLRNVVIFRQLKSEAMARWEAQCKWKTFDAKESILGADDETCDIFFLVEYHIHTASLPYYGKTA